MKILQDAIYEAQKRANSIPVQVYEKSHEGLNRDSCINVAKILAESVGQNEKKNFVFISASQSILPSLQNYAQMKREAEEYLLKDVECKEKLNPFIVRPGLVWHAQSRSWSLPFKLFTDVGFCIKERIEKNTEFDSESIRKILPESGSINLDRLSDICIMGALSEDAQKYGNKSIWSNEDMNLF